MSTFAIRRLTPDDAAAYRAFRLAGLARHPEAFRSDAEEEAAKPLSATTKRLSVNDDCHWFAAFDPDGNIVGAAGVEREEKFKARHIAWLYGMLVAPEWQGRGVARALLETAIAAARAMPGVEQLQLTVTAPNPPAQRLYEQYGFVPFGLEPRAIRAGERFYDKEYRQLLLAGVPTIPNDPAVPTRDAALSN